MRSASAVSHHTSKSATQPPASDMAGSATTSGAPAANSAMPTGQSRMSVIARRRGWRGRQRSAISEPAIVPAPNAANT